jgi:membrane protease YdiL (CAAX protease family)
MNAASLLWILLIFFCWMVIIYALLVKKEYEVALGYLAVFSIYTFLFLPLGWYYAGKVNLPRMIWLRRSRRHYQGITPWQMVKIGILTGFLCMIGSSVLFAYLGAQIDPEFEDALVKSGMFDPGSEFIHAVPVVAAAINEEILFRFVLIGVFMFLLRSDVRKGAVVAVILSSLFWTVFHCGMVIPFGIKEVQIFTIGCIFGALFLRYGVEVCIIAHFVLNFNVMLGMIFISDMPLPK